DEPSPSWSAGVRRCQRLPVELTHAGDGRRLVLLLFKSRAGPKPAAAGHFSLSRNQDVPTRGRPDCPLTHLTDSGRGRPNAGGVSRAPPRSTYAVTRRTTIVESSLGGKPARCRATASVMRVTISDAGSLRASATTSMSRSEV